MANFDKLEQALREWVREAVARASSGSEPDISLGLPRWQRDTDGVFRKRERPVRVWPHAEAEALRRQLPSWPAVEQALQEDDRIRPQLGQLVGTIQGVGQFDAETAARHVLPLPDEVGDLEGVFGRRYSELDRFLAADELEYVVIWPLPGLTSTELPIVLEQGVELDIMTDEELTAVLNTEVLQLGFPGLPLLAPEQDKQACLRYRYRLPKVIGDIDPQAPEQFVASEERLNGMRETLEQVLALLSANPGAISGRASFLAEWSPVSGGVVFQQVALTSAQRFRKMHLDEQASADVVETWRQLRQPGLLQKQKALALALRRLSATRYTVNESRTRWWMSSLPPRRCTCRTLGIRNLLRGRPRDVSSQVPELRQRKIGITPFDCPCDNFRLSLRAAALCDPQKLGMTRRNAFDLMKSAYGVRSTIVHGEVPKAKDLKVKGAQVSLADFVQATEEVVRQGLREALDRATNPRSKWPPDWDGMTLPK